MSDDEVPLDITGHEDRDDPRSAGDSNEEAGVFPENTPSEDSIEDSPEDSSEDTSEDSETSAIDREELLDEVDPNVDPDVEDDEGVQPVELLVNLAEDGEIDPWDIDIVRVTDKFLARLDDSDLRTSGRALFYASVLLRMKGDDLLRIDEEPEEEELEPWEQEMQWAGDDAQGFDPIDQLEAEMDRRLERKRVRGSPETLDELVHELRDAERRQWWKEARTYDTSGSPSGFGRGTQTLDYHMNDAGRMGGEPTEAEVTGTTHDEDIESVIDDVRAVVREHYDRGREEVLYAEIEQTGGSRVMTYLALLFLAHRGQIALQQDDLFGDLWIRDTGVTIPSDGAIAD